MTTPIDLLESLDLNIGGKAAAIVSDAPTIRSRVARSTPARPSARGALYFDLETIPDVERFELFGLDPIPPSAKRATLGECVHGPVKFLDATIPAFKASIAALNPCDEYLDQLEAAERAAPKPRAGILDAIADVRIQDAARAALVSQQRKEMACSPEMNRIVAMGWAFADGPARSMVVGEKTLEAVEIDERLILETFWQLAASAAPIIGFNILGFDLPTVFVRSMLLDVKPSRRFDLKPWGTDCVDLMAVRFPKSSAKRLKWLAKAMGIPVPAGDVDGSQVEELWRTDKAKVGEYVRSDVEVSRELHRVYRGFFC